MADTPNVTKTNKIPYSRDSRKGEKRKKRKEQHKPACCVERGRGNAVRNSERNLQPEEDRISHGRKRIDEPDRIGVRLKHRNCDLYQKKEKKKPIRAQKGEEIGEEIGD